MSWHVRGGASGATTRRLLFTLSMSCRPRALRRSRARRIIGTICSKLYRSRALHFSMPLRALKIHLLGCWASHGVMASIQASIDLEEAAMTTSWRSAKRRQVVSKRL